MDKSIEYILEVARCGGITKAAGNLYITPSALSKFIQAREEELSVRLFHRVGKKFVLTQAGECYVQKSREIEKIQIELNLQMKRFSSMSHGELRLGVQASFTDVMLGHILPEFQRQFPGVRIVLHEYASGTLIQMLRDQQLDIVVTLVDRKEAGLQVAVLQTCELVLAVNRENPLVVRGIKREEFRYPWIDLRICREEPAAMLMPGSPYRGYADKLYTHYGVEPNMVFQFGATRTGLTSVALNRAVMITLDHMVLNCPFQEEIRLLSVGEYPLMKDLAVLYGENGILQEEIRCFVRIAGQFIL